MSKTLRRIRALIENQDIRISAHGYEELANDGLTARELINGFAQAVPVEDYPDYPKGPCVLLLQQDQQGRPVHVLWGIPRGHQRPAVLITAYHPDPKRWNPDFTERTT